MGLPALAVSSAEVVTALQRGGFLTRRGLGCTVLERAHRVVVVPDARTLAPEVFSAALRAAAVTYTEFLDLLSEAPTEPARSAVRICIADDDDG